MFLKGESKSNELTIVVSGQAGQGVKTVEYILTRIFKSAGLNVFSCKEYMSRVRGGINSATIRVSTFPVRAYKENIDILLPLDKGLTKHLAKRISGKTVIVGDKIWFEFNKNVYDVNFAKLAEECGNKIFANIVACAVVLGMIGFDFKVLRDYIRKYFVKKGKEIVEKNIEAAEKGYNRGLELALKVNLKVDFKFSSGVKDHILPDGSEAVALGAVAGGLNFISAYPMTPSTGVFTFLSSHAKSFGIVSEQAEDEISSINMAIGAWYAGAKAMTTTSGGGFALMTEAVSLCGMIESPMVIYIAQRPGPATGVPTRTEQGDLNLALYAGHGDFPRMIFAPGSLEQCFSLAKFAFEQADKYQIPVFILTDQYLVDLYYNVPVFDLKKRESKDFIVKTKADYKRYELTSTGISLRGIPDFGRGLVYAASDEHFEDGHSTEDLEMKEIMVEKRFKKEKLVRKDVLSPELIGSENYKILLVGWGSIYHAVEEALNNAKRKDVAFLHFSQVYPLSEKTALYLKKAKKLVAIENNVSGQFADLIKKEFGINMDKRVLKFNGLPFSVEEIEKLIKSL